MQINIRASSIFIGKQFPLREEQLCRLIFDQLNLTSHSLRNRSGLWISHQNLATSNQMSKTGI